MEGVRVFGLIQELTEGVRELLNLPFLMGHLKFLHFSISFPGTCSKVLGEKSDLATAERFYTAAWANGNALPMTNTRYERITTAVAASGCGKAGSTILQTATTALVPHA